MKSYYKILFFACAALFFSSCSNYTRYWHQEEDDVYFTSTTLEDVDIDGYEAEPDDDDQRWRTIDQPRRSNDWDQYDRYPRRNRGYRPPIINRPNSKDQPRTTPQREPKPDRPSRPSRPSKPNRPTNPM